MSAMPVLLVDDHPLFAQGMALLIERELGLAAVRDTSCEAALQRLQRGENFSLVLLDLELPGLSGIEGVARIGALRPGLPVVVCSSHQGELARNAVLERGARAFVSKADAPDRLLAALRRALAGAAIPAAPPRAAGELTARQQQVLLLLAEGKSNKVIARALEMSENTVRNHVAALLDRLGAANRHEAAAAARRLGLLA
jgi:DNA-binding NarL/FixJ family response regulator